jgi:hypothetical protein
VGGGMGMRGGLPYEGDLRRGQGVGLVDEVAEGALQGQGFGGEGAGGFDRSSVRAWSVERRRRSAAVSCPPHLPLRLRVFAPLLFTSTAGFSFQRFASWPVEQRALDLLLVGSDFDQAPNEIGANQSAGMNSDRDLNLLGRHKVLNAAYPDEESPGFRSDRNSRALFCAQVIPSWVQNAGRANKVSGAGLKAEIQFGTALRTNVQHGLQMRPGAGTVLQNREEIDLAAAGVAGHRERNLLISGAFALPPARR